MSHKHGAYLGGIRTLEDLRQRCRIDEETGCWRWAMHCHADSGYPCVCYTLPGEKSQRRNNGRRAALELERGARLGKGMLASPRVRCKHVDCVNPAHALAVTYKQRGAMQKQSGVLRCDNDPLRLAKLIAERRRVAKLTIEQAREIRASSETLRVDAARYGVCQSAISAIRRGETWREGVVGASVFSWSAA